MINYDLPWNPTRLEQRLGRIHRIGQDRDVHAFNFVASESEEGQPIIEGRILERLLRKWSRCGTLWPTAFSTLSAKCCRSTMSICPRCSVRPPTIPAAWTTTSTRSPASTRSSLLQYEEATGIALARANVDFSGFQQANAEAEERRLMPRYVEEHFIKAAREWV